MDHVAVMKKSWGLIPKILSGEKTIESRWYQSKRTPWNKVNPADTVYFKNSGEPVSASAKVWKAKQFELSNLREVKNILQKYGRKIQLINENPETWPKLPRYCILLFLENAREIQPFNIDKTGFGGPTAWIAVDHIEKIKKRTI